MVPVTEVEVLDRGGEVLLRRYRFSAAEMAAHDDQVRVEAAMKWAGRLDHMAGVRARSSVWASGVRAAAKTLRELGSSD